MVLHYSSNRTLIQPTRTRVGLREALTWRARISYSPAVSGCCMGLVTLSEQVVATTTVATNPLNMEDNAWVTPSTGKVSGC